MFEEEVLDEKKTLSGGALAGGRPARGREEDDFYATDPGSTRALFDNFEFKGNSFLEPCAGQGHISKVIKEYFPNAEVVSTDLVDRGFCEGGIDFLIHDYDRIFDNVITNPPFKLAKEFIEKSLDLVPTGGHVAMFLKIQFLEGVSRKEFFEEGCLKYVYVFSARQSPWRAGSPVDEKGKKWSSTMCFCWYIFEKGYKGDAVIKWL